MCLQAQPFSGFSAAETTSSEKHKQIKGIKPLKINSVHKVINEKQTHQINVSEKCVHKIKQHTKQSKVTSSNIKTLKMFSTNGAGIVNGKIDSLKHEVKAVGAAVVTVQETHCRRKGRIQMDNMVVFKAIQNRKGGGTICAIHEDLDPKLIEEYNDPFELLVVEVMGNKRIITGYGPQETWEEHKRVQFLLKLEEEIVKASMIGKSVIIEMDANAKLGPNYIPRDPHSISPIGKLLEGIIQRQNLYVVNGSRQCKGNITRKRTTKNKVEQSVIDIVLVSSDLIGHLESLEIDEERRHVLTKIRKTKKGIIKKENDHNILVTIFNNTFESNETKEKEEVYNLKNKDCQKKFKKYTSNTNMLSSVLDSDEHINLLTDRLIRKIHGCIASTFKKVRITNNKKSKLERLYGKLSELKEDKNIDAKQEEVAKIVEKIAEQEHEKYNRIVTKLSNTKHQDKLNVQSFWKILRDLQSHCSEEYPRQAHVQ